MNDEDDFDRRVRRGVRRGRIMDWVLLVIVVFTLIVIVPWVWPGT